MLAQNAVHATLCVLPPLCNLLLHGAGQTSFPLRPIRVTPAPKQKKKLEKFFLLCYFFRRRSLRMLSPAKTTPTRSPPHDASPPTEPSTKGSVYCFYSYKPSVGLWLNPRCSRMDSAPRKTLAYDPFTSLTLKPKLYRSSSPSRCCAPPARFPLWHAAAQRGLYFARIPAGRAGGHHFWLPRGRDLAHL